MAAYAVTGTKIFITAVSIDLTRHQFHLCGQVTRRAGQPRVFGCFWLTPSFLVNADGSLGKRNRGKLWID